MARFHSLNVYHLACAVLRDSAAVSARCRGFGDLSQQIQRSAVSVVSNICEGAASGSDRQFARYLVIARASANELQAQLGIARDLGFLAEDHPVHDRCDHLGRALTRLKRSLEVP